jgi:hypothetical protein
MAVRLSALRAGRFLPPRKIPGDINSNYFNDSTYKQSLDLILASYGLSSIVQFPARIQENSYSTIDNIYTYKYFQV